MVIVFTIMEILMMRKGGTAPGSHILPDITMEFQGEGQEFIARILPGDIQGDGDSGRISAPPRRRITSYRSERPLAYSDAYVGLR